MRTLLGTVGIVVLALGAAAASAEESKPALVDCQMKFNIKGWSAFYKTSKGEGTITCSNGATAKVTIKATGGGITFGKSEIIDATGKFTGAKSIDELFGSYVQAEAHAGAGKSADAQALTKGEVSLAISGTGRGVDVGFAFGKFTIKKAG
ncbi:MAG: hypothetical protein ACREAA_19520 [Candidatus Polarisedimenticolia bacterium]